MKKLWTLAGVLLLAFSVSEVAAEPPLTPLDPQRIIEVKGELTDHTTGYGEPISNREAWDKIATYPSSKGVISAAERISKTPMMPWDQELMLSYKTSGIRKNADDMYKSRSSRLFPLVMAECIENKGRFIEAIEQTLDEYCAQPSWVMVAHDNDQDNLFGREYHVDLGSSSMADQLGQTLYMLGDKLAPACVERILEKLYERVYNPVLNSYRTLDERRKHGWITRNNNWNLVCVAGVTSSALAAIEDLDLRAEFVAAAEKYIQYGIEGFLEDGYCPEGVGYYNYGFTSLIRLRESLYRATDGEIDLFETPRMQKVATFGTRSEIINGVYPAITDCRPGVVPSDWISWYCNRAFSWEQSVSRDYTVEIGSSLDALISCFSDSPCKIKGDATESSKAIRSYFDKADVLSCRPFSNEWDTALGLNIKGGTNDESHNHNDVGSYTLVAGDDLMMGDMGGPYNYTAKTFSSERYTLYKMFSSYGHPVPYIDEVEQYESEKAIGRVITRKFTDKRDVVLYDIASSYPTDKITKLTREFVYNRKKDGQTTVTDLLEASSPVSFETAITTRQEIEVEDDKVMLISDDNKVEVSIKASAPFTISLSEVTAYAFDSFTRIAITLDKDVTSGTIELTYTNVK